MQTFRKTLTTTSPKVWAKISQLLKLWTLAPLGLCIPRRGTTASRRSSHCCAEQIELASWPSQSWTWVQFCWPNPIQSNPWMDPIHVQLWAVLRGVRMYTPDSSAVPRWRIRNFTSLILPTKPVSVSSPLVVRRIRFSTVGDRLFRSPFSGATVWNDLPLRVASAPSLSVLRQRLETFLFSRSYRTKTRYDTIR